MSRIKVEHAGISPEDYNRRNYVEPGQLEEGRQLRGKDRGLPALMPVSRPAKVDSTTNPRKENAMAAKAPPNAKAVADANTKDLKNRGLTK